MNFYIKGNIRVTRESSYYYSKHFLLVGEIPVAFLAVPQLQGMLQSNLEVVFSIHAAKLCKIAEADMFAPHFQSRWCTVMLKAREGEGEDLCLNKKTTMELCKCFLFLSQMNIQNIIED